LDQSVGNTSDYNYNNVQMYVMTWGHRFSQSVHMQTEAYYMYGRNVPGFGPDGEPAWSLRHRIRVRRANTA
jgi:hypothetical protein